MADRPYTSRAQEALRLSDAASESLGDEFIGTEHLLIGILEEKTGIAAQFLNHLGVTTDKVNELLVEARSRR